MFLRSTNRRKDGKDHRYFSVVENRRIPGGKTAQRTVLYLGEINDRQQAAWRKTLDVFDEAEQRFTSMSLCACSPLGKIQATSQPYAPGATEYWTTYTYDGIGRALAKTLPDGASTTTYSYTGNATVVTDPAGNWNSFATDVSGNLITAWAPDPLTGSYTSTFYTYDWMNHLVGVSMTRGSTTQTRTFVYNNAGQLMSATNPENGTVTYSYSADTTLWGKTDAKGQLTVYGYDAAKRVTSVHVYPYGWGGGEDTCQLVTYGYDAGTNGQGRLTSAAYGVPNPGSGYPISGSCPGMANGYAYQDSYTYDAPGQVTNKTFTLTTDDPAWGGWPTSASIGISYSYDSAGRLSTATYPQVYGATAPTYTYGYDSMGRPVSMADNIISSYTGVGNQWVQNGQYDPAGHVTSLTLYNATSPGSPPWWSDYKTEASTYNVNGQLTGLNWQYTSYPGYQVLNLEYNYSTTQNNGQITQMVDGISGETVSYAYDALKRLISASSAPTSGSTPTAWTQAFGYDGFGNMTSKTLNGGANMAPAVDPTTNRLTSGYDANGNMLTGYGLTMTYDGRNRVASATPTYSGTEYYGYAPDNKRIYRWNPTTGTEEWTFYGAKGERIGTFALNTSGTYSFGETVENIWFGKKLISRVVSYGDAGALMVVRDRLGTDRETGARYYPYGDEITSTANGTEKYGTYFRDSFTAMDYADQRYYASAYGRFNTPDPARSAHPKNPLSWNRYSYTAGDPVNRNDRRGLCYFDLTIGVGFGTYEDWQEAVYQNWDGAMSSDTMDDEGSAACTDGDGGSISVTDSTDPVPCALSSGASVSCDDSSSGGGIEINPVFLSGMQDGTGGFDGFLGVFAGGSAAVGTLGALAPLAPSLATLLPRLGGLNAAEAMVTGLYGSVSEAALTAAAQSAGPTVTMLTNLSQAPQAGLALSAAAGANAAALAGAAMNGTQLYSANIPQALLSLMVNAGLALPSITYMGGVTGTEYQFTAAGSAFVTNFFSQIP